MKFRLFTCTFLLAAVIFHFNTSDLFAAADKQADLANLQQQFINLPPESLRLSGPLFWLHGDESKEKLEMYVEKVAEGGNGCFTAESRPHNDWLGDNWYRDLQICLDAAKKNNLKMWIFDERWWPSGEVGGMVPQQYGSKYMQAKAIPVQQNKDTAVKIETDKLIAVLAGKNINGKIDGNSLIDLTAKIKNGTISWQPPSDNWQIMIFSWKYSDKRHGSYLVDGASREAVDWYIETVYQPHYDHFKDDFGTWIPGFFYDEPETHGDWGTEVIPMLKERGIDWKKALVAWKLELNGPEQTAARYQYQDAFAEAWGRTLFGGITEWCCNHNVKSIGHFLEHNKEYLANWACAGNMFQLQKYSDMGAIDAVFSQFVIGQRGAQDRSTWQTPKLGSSISHAYGKQDDIAMVEIFGARGQDLTYPEMKWWTDHMHVSGINFHIQHSFNPRSPYDNDCPPYFYNGGEEPRWPLYKVYADYTSRLSLMLTGGRHVCPVALLYLGNSCHVGKAVLPERMSESLQDALYDCDWLPYDVFENNVTLANKEMNLYQEKYKVLIVPPVEVIPYKTLKKAYNFFQAGGTVIGYDFLPEKSADLNHTSKDILNLCQNIWGNAVPGLNVCRTSPSGGRSYFLPANPTPKQMQTVLADNADIHSTLEVLEGETDNWLHVLHRVKDNNDIFFICNQNNDSISRNFHLRIKASGFPECWDPMRGEITSLPCKRSGEHVELNLKLDSLESTLIVFNPVNRRLPKHLDIANTRPEKALKVTPTDTSDLVYTRKDSLTGPLSNCSWVWLTGQNAASSVAPGFCYFRNTFDLPQIQKIEKAAFIATADNEITLYINGTQIDDKQGNFNEWHNISNVDIRDALVSNRNTIAIRVLNATDKPSPAGLIGKITLTLADGSTREIKIDQSWKAHDRLVSNWQNSDFNDSSWSSVAAFAPYGSNPWGRPGCPMLTLSPIQQSQPFAGYVELPEVPQNNLRYILYMDSIQPEAAARISVNGTYTGGCIGTPLYKDITSCLTKGRNTINIEPFTPNSVELRIYSN